MAADIAIFDPDTVRPMPETVVHDFPATPLNRPHSQSWFRNSITAC
jgi:hypothetical protein